MRTISISELQLISGGDTVNAFCIGFGSVASVYGAGVYLNLWNPVGWTAGAAGALIGVGCAAYYLI